MVANGYEGWGNVGMKPSHEPIAFCRKPIEKGLTVAENCLKWGTGGINIDESRVEYQSEDDFNSCGWSKMGKEHIGKQQATEGEERWTTGMKFIGDFRDKTKGRFPANLIHDNSEEVRECFPNESERFFKSIIYQAKASKSERNKGRSIVTGKQIGRAHV